MRFFQLSGILSNLKLLGKEIYLSTYLDSIFAYFIYLSILYILLCTLYSGKFVLCFEYFTSIYNKNYWQLKKKIFLILEVCDLLKM